MLAPKTAEITNRSAVTINGLTMLETVIQAPKDKSPFRLCFSNCPDTQSAGSLRCISHRWATSTTARAVTKLATIQTSEVLINITLKAGSPKLAAPRPIRSRLTTLKSS